MRGGSLDEERLEARLLDRGLMSRGVLKRLGDRIHSSWQMYPLGVLFGLGFDTATEVGLLALSAGAAGRHMPFAAVLSLPLLFAAGMSLLDTADGAFMSHAYSWAFSSPVRKVYYNITVTALSVTVALGIGGARAPPARRPGRLARRGHARVRNRRALPPHVGRLRGRLEDESHRGALGRPRARLIRVRTGAGRRRRRDSRPRRRGHRRRAPGGRSARGRAGRPGPSAPRARRARSRSRRARARARGAC